MESWKTPFRWLILIIAIMASSIGVFVASPPDNMTSNSDPEQNLQMELFDAMLDVEPLNALNLREGKQVVCFFSTSCEYCQLAAHKLSLMQRFYGFPTEKITFVFMGNEESVLRFYEQSESARYRDIIYRDVARMLKAVNGHLPTIVLMENGVVVHEYGFRNMDESEIKDFFLDEH